MAEGSRNFPLERLREILLKAWQEAGVSKECELCRNPTWTIFNTPDFDGLAIPTRSGSLISNPFQAYMVYALECTNCGNVRTFSKTAIEKLSGVQSDDPTGPLAEMEDDPPSNP